MRCFCSELWLTRKENLATAERAGWAFLEDAKGTKVKLLLEILLKLTGLVKSISEP